MASNINEFDRELKVFAQIIVPNAHKDVVKKVATEALRRVVNKTPVDTGRARSNWMTALNTIPSETVELTADLTREQASAVSINRGLSVIDSAQPFTTISIANNLPYIGVLEYGGSKQAPEGMVRVTLAELEAMFA